MSDVEKLYYNNLTALGENLHSLPIVYMQTTGSRKFMNLISSNQFNDQIIEVFVIIDQNYQGVYT